MPANLLHEEYRDDRYVAAMNSDGGEAKLFYLVRAVTPGTYTGAAAAVGGHVPPRAARDRQGAARRRSRWCSRRARRCP